MSLDALPRHDVSLIIGGAAYLGWTDLRIERGLDTLVGHFALGLVARAETGGAAWTFAAGVECTVALGGEALITGHVDAVGRQLTAEGQSLRLAGRDKAADMVDCSAVIAPGSWRRTGLDTIARALAERFGVAVTITADTGAPLERFAIQQGETAFAAIERLARYRGLIVNSDGRGGIRIGNPESGLRGGDLIEGDNVALAEWREDWASLHSVYIVKGQASGSDERNGATVAQVSADAADSGVNRYRPLLLIGEEQSDAAGLARRAAWERDVRRARSRGLSVTVPGWFTAGDRVWSPGMRSRCAMPALQVDGDWLVERVTLVRDEAGTRSELTLVPPEAWAQLAEAEPAP